VEFGLKQLDVCLLQAGDKSAYNKPTSSAAAGSSVKETSKASVTSAGKPSNTQTESTEVVRSRLMKLEPKDLMKEIVSGHVPLSLLNQVAGRLPAKMLQEAVDFLSKTGNDGTPASEPSSQTQTCESFIHVYTANRLITLC